MTGRLLALLALALSSLGCSDDAALLRVNVRSDVAQLRWVYVGLRDAAGTALPGRWFDVAACGQVEGAPRELGSLLVRRTSSRPLASLDVRGYREDAAGLALPWVEARVDVRFRGQSSEVDVTLASTCVGVACDRAADLSCAPALGACQRVEPLDARPARKLADEPYCLSAREGVPDGASDATLAPDLTVFDGGVAVDAPRDSDGAAATRCQSGDGHCAQGCQGLDLDCLLAIGEACDPARGDLCMSGGRCMHGVCCERACDGACERCDLRGSVGLCKPLRHAVNGAPLNAPGLRAACPSDHVRVSCEGETCSAGCEPGHDDCDGDMQTNGCEAPLGTPEQCAQCGDVCEYGFCDPAQQRCVFHTTESSSVAEGSWPLAPGSLYATGVSFASSDTHVRALGALVDARMAGSRLRLALYGGDNHGVPGNVIEGTQSPDLTPAASARGSLTMGAEALRVEWKLPAPVALDPQQGSFFIALQAERNTQLLAAVGEQGAPLAWFADQPYAEFPLAFPLDAAVRENVSLSVYAITTP